MLEFMGWSAMLGVHLSRWAEDLIIYGSKEFGYVKFADAYATVYQAFVQRVVWDGNAALPAVVGWW